MSIIHPISKDRLSIFYGEGRALLKEYIRAFMTGGSESIEAGEVAFLNDILSFLATDAKHDLKGSYKSFENMSNNLLRYVAKIKSERGIPDVGNCEPKELYEILDIYALKQNKILNDIKTLYTPGNPPLFHVYTEANYLDIVQQIFIRRFGKDKIYNSNCITKKKYNKINWKIVKDTCTDAIYKMTKKIVKYNDRNLIELIGLPQFLDPSNDLYPTEGVPYEFYRFEEGDVSPFGNFNILCRDSTYRDGGIFDTNNFSCSLSVVKKIRPKPLEARKGSEKYKNWEWLLLKELQQTCKLTITLPNELQIEIEFGFKKDLSGPVSYISNENILFLHLFLDDLFEGNEILYLADVTDSTGQIKPEFLGKTIIANSDWGYVIVGNNLNITRRGVDKYLDVSYNIVDTLSNNEGLIEYIKSLNNVQKETLKGDFKKMFYALKHTGDGGSISFAYKLCKGYINPSSVLPTITPTLKSHKPEPGIIFISGDRLCAANFIAKCCVDPPEIPTICIYYGKRGTREIYDLSPLEGILEGRSFKSTPKRTRRGGAIYDDTSDLFNDVFMNFNEIEHTKDFNYLNLYDFHKIEYLGNLKYMYGMEGKSEWECAGFLSEVQFQLYKQDDNNLNHYITELNTDEIIANNYILKNVLSQQCQLIQIVDGVEYVIHSGRNAGIYFKYILKNRGFTIEGVENEIITGIENIANDIYAREREEEDMAAEAEFEDVAREFIEIERLKDLLRAINKKRDLAKNKKDVIAAVPTIKLSGPNTSIILEKIEKLRGLISPLYYKLDKFYPGGNSDDKVKLKYEFDLYKLYEQFIPIGSLYDIFNERDTIFYPPILENDLYCGRCVGCQYVVIRKERECFSPVFPGTYEIWYSIIREALIIGRNYLQGAEEPLPSEDPYFKYTLFFTQEPEFLIRYFGEYFDKLSKGFSDDLKKVNINTMAQLVYNQTIETYKDVDILNTIFGTNLTTPLPSPERREPEVSPATASATTLTTAKSDTLIDRAGPPPMINSES